MVLLVKNTVKSYLHELDGDEIKDIAEGWHDAIRAIHYFLPAIGRQTSYNVVTHNGPGAGLYFEFLPYTQETGGFEHLGLYVCQSHPYTTARNIKEFFKNEAYKNNPN
jgi:hypothetical protein